MRTKYFYYFQGLRVLNCHWTKRSNRVNYRSKWPLQKTFYSSTSPPAWISRVFQPPPPLPQEFPESHPWGGGAWNNPFCKSKLLRRWKRQKAIVVHYFNAIMIIDFQKRCVERPYRFLRGKTTHTILVLQESKQVRGLDQKLGFARRMSSWMNTLKFAQIILKPWFW